MKERDARLLMDVGALHGATVTPAPMEPARWAILLHRADGQEVQLERQRGGLRTFATLDAAAAALGALGFRSFEVRRAEL